MIIEIEDTKVERMEIMLIGENLSEQNKFKFINNNNNNNKNNKIYPFIS